jgi:hypothetical protein
MCALKAPDEDELAAEQNPLLKKAGRGNGSASAIRGCAGLYDLTQCRFHGRARIAPQAGASPAFRPRPPITKSGHSPAFFLSLVFLCFLPRLRLLCFDLAFFLTAGFPVFAVSVGNAIAGMESRGSVGGRTIGCS